MAIFIMVRLCLVNKGDFLETRMRHLVSRRCLRHMTQVSHHPLEIIAISPPNMQRWAGVVLYRGFTLFRRQKVGEVGGRHLQDVGQVVHFEYLLNQITIKPMIVSPGIQMDSGQEVFEEQQGEGGGGSGGGEERRGKRGRDEEDDEGGVGPVRGQERRDPLSRRQGRGIGK